MEDEWECREDEALPIALLLLILDEEGMSSDSERGEDEEEGAHFELS